MTLETVARAPALLRLPEVQRRTGLSKTSIYLGIASNNFPAPIKLGKRAIAWPEEVISEWILSKIAPAAAAGKPKP